MSLHGVCDHGNPAGSCFVCDYAGEAKREARAFHNLFLTAAALVLLSLACFIFGGGCSSETGFVDAGAADAGGEAAPAGDVDAGTPQCRALAQGEEFFAALAADAAPAFLINQCGCSRLCRNTAGGQTCIDSALALVDCRACEQGCAP